MSIFRSMLSRERQGPRLGLLLTINRSIKSIEVESWWQWYIVFLYCFRDGHIPKIRYDTI